ncbi:XdhC family protein [Vreelandella nanhaiensis]|uniref:XdhC family protein n=1 Tax=Vreelandella nanhaiensis TaxID=1258546 RepID=A0A433KU80_9GAMM|nr:XdhC family protein [Halomonas nanhaiensis]RUR33205.1 XdhC family protein [Halomonas nanhaiensis]
MQHLDLQVIERALQWANQGHVVWLCTVLTTFGSSPREPGAVMAACSKEQFIGSLSGGCIEENFLERLEKEIHSASPVQLIHYGGEDDDTVRLPCGGRLSVLVERLEPSADTLIHLEVVHATLMGRRPLIRHVLLDGSRKRFIVPEGPGPAVTCDEHAAYLRIGPSLRLIIAGISTVAVPCAQFAQALGFEVIVCDPRKEMRRDFNIPGVEVQAVLPSLFIASGACHAATAIVALTHDPRIDDLAMIEAVRTDAFYIGVMGSTKTSAQRAERLRRSGGLTDTDIARIVMPIGLNLGSKTPAEIALATMADIMRTYRGK